MTPAKIVDGLFEEIARIEEASVRRIYGDFSNRRSKGWSFQLAATSVLSPNPSGFSLPQIGGIFHAARKRHGPVRRNESTEDLLDIVPPRKERPMGNDNNKNPNVRQPGENPDGKYHFNPGNMAGKNPKDAKQMDKNRDETHKPKEKPAD
jgi:hypothetical protein